MATLAEDGTIRAASKEERLGFLSPGSKLVRFSDLPKPGPGSRFDVSFYGKNYRSEPRWWGFTPDGLKRVKAAGRIAQTGKTISFVRCLDDFPAAPINNVWIDVGGISRSI